LKGRLTSSGVVFIHIPSVLLQRQWQAVLALTLLGLCAGPARGQMTTGHLPVDFGEVPLGTSTTRTALTVAAATDRVIDSVTVTGPSSGEFAVDAGGCGAGSTLTAGSQCSVSITFTPSTGGCRQALLRVASHDVATNQTFLDVAALIGAGGAAAPAGTVPLVMPLSIRTQSQGLALTPIAGTPESTITVINPTILASRGGLSQVAIAGTLITANAGTPVRSVGMSTWQFTGPFFHGTGQDTLVLCAVSTIVPGPGGAPVAEEIFYVASGTGRFTGATGTGRITRSRGPGGEPLSDITGTLTLRIPTGPFAYIYLTDLLRSY
jgi:hypothetical protein